MSSVVKSGGKKVGKVGVNVGKKVGTTVHKKFKKKPGPGPAIVGDDVSRKGQKKKKGLQVHFTVKVRRVTQIDPRVADKPVEILYSNGKDRARNRVTSSPLTIDNGIAIVPKDEPPYEFDVILRPWDEEVAEDEVPWRPHPVMFSLRTERDMTPEELEHLREKLEKKLEKKKKKEKNAPPTDTPLDEPGVDELQEMLDSKKKMEVIGTKAQLDLAQYAEDGCNVTEAFGVPNPRPKKKKKKKKKTDEEEPEEEPEEEEYADVPVTMAYKMVASVQATFVRYMGRSISKDLSLEGERVMIGPEEWVYTEPPPPEEEEEFDEDDPLGIGLTEEEIQQLEPKVRDKLMKELHKKEKAHQRAAREAEKEEEKVRKAEEKEHDRYMAKQEALARDEEKRQAKLDKEDERAHQQKVAAAEAKASQAEREMLEKERAFEEQMGKELEREKQEAKQLEKERLRREKEEKKALRKSRSGSSRVSSTPSRKRSNSNSSSGGDSSEPSTPSRSRKSSSKSSSSQVQPPSGAGGGPGPRMKVTANVSVQFLSVTGCERREGKMVYISWRRGSKKENTGETQRAFCEEGKADLSDYAPLRFASTFTKSSKKQHFEEKTFSLAVKEDSGKKGTLIGDAHVDLAQYTPRSGEKVSREIDVPVNPSGKSSDRLTVRLRLEIVPDGGPTVVADPLALTTKPSAVSSSKKNRAKVCFQLLPLRLDQVSGAEEFLFVKWSRGTKKTNHGHTQSVPSSQPFWTDEEPPIVISSTMERKSSGEFHSKKLLFTLYTSKAADQSKAKSLGKASLNLADYAKPDFSQECTFTLQKDKKGMAGLLSVHINATWSQYEGKRLTSVPSNTSHVNPQRIMAIDGKDYVLQTADDCSEMSDVTHDSFDPDDDSEEVEDVFQEEAREPAPLKSRSSSKSSKIMHALHLKKDKDKEKEKQQAKEKPTSSSRKPESTRSTSSHSVRSEKSAPAQAAPASESKKEAPVDPELASKLQHARNEVEKLQQTLKQVEEQKRESDEELQRMMAGASESEKLTALRQKLARLQEEDKERTSVITEQEKQLTEYKQMNETLASHKQVLEEKLQKAVGAISIAQKQMTSLAAEAKRLQQENQEKEEQIRRFEERLNSLQHDASKSLKKKGGDKAQHLTAVFEQQLQLVREQSQQNKERAAAAHQECKRLEQEVAVLTEKLGQTPQSSAAQATADDTEFLERTQILHRNLLFAAREFELDTRRPQCIEELSEYYAKYQDDVEVILELLQMIGLMARNAGSDHHSVCYWLAVGTGLCASLQEEDLYDGDISSRGIVPPTSECKSMAEVTQASQLPIAMDLFTYDLYNLLLNQIFDELDQHLEESFISSQDLVMSERVKFSDPNRSVEVTIRILEKVQEAFVANYILPVIIGQCFNQLVHYISASLFNRIITTPSLCKPQYGLQVKMGVSHLRSWLIQNAKRLPMLLPAETQLRYIVELTNVLTLATNESVFQPEYLSSTFPSLNLAQIRKLLELYSPDKYSPEPVPVTVKRFINSACQADSSVRNMPLELDPVLPLSKSIPNDGEDDLELDGPSEESLNEEDDEDYDEEISF